ncbi:MAG: asparaginase, partial [Geodermatophilaceae bacterium]|nr:asparaginase [Geodermatophilaceae bacterium]
EPEHADLVRTTLRAAGLSEPDLQCPPALPMNEAARNAVLAAGGGSERAYMNCSGKHAAMLLTCLANGWPTDSYLATEHPLQVQLRRVLGDYAAEALEPATVDGCGAPLFGMSLAGLARAFVRFADESGHARTVADAMRAHPFYVAGTGREDTELMTELPGVLSKAGAEGVHVAAVPGAGSVVVKIDDGNERARMPVVVAGLRRLGLTGEVLDRWASGLVLGGGLPVGTIHAIDDIFS